MTRFRFLVSLLQIEMQMKQRKTLKSGYEIYNFPNSIADVESGYIDCVDCRKLYHVSCAGMGVSLISIFISKKTPLQ